MFGQIDSVWTEKTMPYHVGVTIKLLLSRHNVFSIIFTATFKFKATIQSKISCIADDFRIVLSGRSAIVT
jgi:hypothetical protein